MRKEGTACFCVRQETGGDILGSETGLWQVVTRKDFARRMARLTILVYSCLSPGQVAPRTTLYHINLEASACYNRYNKQYKNYISGVRNFNKAESRGNHQRGCKSDMPGLHAID